MLRLMVLVTMVQKGKQFSNHQMYKIQMVVPGHKLPLYYLILIAKLIVWKEGLYCLH